MRILEFLKKYKKVIGICYLIGFLFGLFFCPWKTFFELITCVILTCTSLLGIVIALISYSW